MKLSIITICYNEEDVQNTCNSIVNQSWQEFEWIVIDGGSKEWCLELFEPYKERINYFISEKDNGIYDAMNKGVLQSKGEYLLFMNAGDSLHDEKVLEDVFVNNSFIEDIIYGQELYLFPDETSAILGEEYDFTDPYFWEVFYLLRHQTAFIKKQLFDNYGLYDLKYRSASDFDMFLRFLYVHKVSSRYIERVIDIYKGYGGLSSEHGKIGKNECGESLKHNKVQSLYQLNANQLSIAMICRAHKSIYLRRHLAYRIKRFFLNKIAIFIPHRSLRHRLRNIYKNDKYLQR